MTDKEYYSEREEAIRLRRQINDTQDRIDRLNRKNTQLEADLKIAVTNLDTLIKSCQTLDNEIYKIMSRLSTAAGKADVSTKEVSQALNDLTLQYFSFKNLSIASRNITQYNDEYYTKFSYYNDLRRISLGYVVGLDSNLISDENARKKVEKAYLKNTEYWLAYCISAVMLWASDEKEAARRAMTKSLSINYFNSCLFYLLINLRFNRIDAAKKWYLYFLDRTDVNNLGKEWQYLLQAYLFGVFGADEEFQKEVAKSFRNMYSQVEATTVDFAEKFTEKALEFAEMYIHKTDHEYGLLRRNCAEYEELKDLLSAAEKNIEIARYYNQLAEKEITEDLELPQRIENTLYSLINSYDAEEFTVIKKIKYNEAIIKAKGDIKSAQASYDAMFADQNKQKNFGDLMLDWAFADESNQADLSVKRFAVSFMKEPIKKGLVQYPEKYRPREQEKYTFYIDNCKLECSEDEYIPAEKTLDQYYAQNKLKDIFKDKYILIYTGICVLALILLAVLFFYFSPVILTFGILLGLAGSFLLWRRIVDMGKILQKKKRKGKLLLKNTLNELAQWRTAYKEADMKSADLLNAIEEF